MRSFDILLQETGAMGRPLPQTASASEWAGTRNGAAISTPNRAVNRHPILHACLRSGYAVSYQGDQCRRSRCDLCIGWVAVSRIRLRIKAHDTDTAGFTDHVFGLMHLLGFRFAPRIRDLADKRWYVPGKPADFPDVAALVGGSINTKHIR